MKIAKHDLLWSMFLLASLNILVLFLVLAMALSDSFI
jgi:hypothetical protein